MWSLILLIPFSPWPTHSITVLLCVTSTDALGWIKSILYNARMHNPNRGMRGCNYCGLFKMFSFTSSAKSLSHAWSPEEPLYQYVVCCMLYVGSIFELCALHPTNSKEDMTHQRSLTVAFTWRFSVISRSHKAAAWAPPRLNHNDLTQTTNLTTTTVSLCELKLF